MKNKAILYLVKLVTQKVLGLALYFIGAGCVLNMLGIIYFTIYIIASLICGLVILRANEKTLAERNKINTNSPKWDKVLLTIFWLLNYFGIYLIAGLEADKQAGINTLFFIGIVLVLIAGYISVWAVLVNTFLESTARIQKDRKQTVCQNGPYAVIRHPAYSSIIINCIGFGFIFQTVGVIACSICIAIVIVIRTKLEDNMLQNGLEGYKEYTNKVKYKIIPYIW